MRLLSKLVKMFRFLKDNNVPWYKKLFLTLPLIYLIIPYDFMGDFFPGLGQVDDLAVFIIMWPFLKNMMNKYSAADNEKEDSIDKSDSIDLDKDDYDVE
ncbi:MAG: DUF1232 domain-containing protein [Halanaerobiales bacterium]|nr:DUF1232 domain-containing protein [Halanaerobiales bacterium]